MGALSAIRTKLDEPVDAASIAAFRVLFGTLMSVSAVRFIAEGWVDRCFVSPRHFFHYYGFSFVRVLPEPYMTGAFVTLAILGASRVEWALFDFALGSIGAIAAPIYPNSSERETGYILDHSESVGVLCEDEAQREKVERVRADAPRLQHILTFADLGDLAARGRAYAAEHPTALREAAWQAIDHRAIHHRVHGPRGLTEDHPVQRFVMALRDHLVSSPSIHRHGRRRPPRPVAACGDRFEPWSRRRKGSIPVP